MGESKSDILQGTLDLMVLKTLDAMGPMHGYGIARRIEQLSEEALQINQGTIYLCLIRLVQKGWIDASWGTSENNRKAKFYAISKAGKKQLAEETKNWARVSGVIDRAAHPAEVVMMARLRHFGARLMRVAARRRARSRLRAGARVASRDADRGQHPPRHDAGRGEAAGGAPPRRGLLAAIAASRRARISAASRISSRTCASRRG